MVDLLGPGDAGAARALTTTTDVTSPLAGDSWFGDCVGGVSGTGTPIVSKFLNRVLQQMRRVIRASSLSLTGGNADDDLLGQAIQCGGLTYAVAGGSVNAYTATLSPPPPTLPDGMEINVFFGTANTSTSPTLAVNGGSALSILRQGGGAPIAGDVSGPVSLISKAGAWRINGLATSDVSANIQAGTWTSFDDTGTASALVITPSPAITAYAKYQQFFVKLAHNINASATLNVSGLAAKAITFDDGTAVGKNDFLAGAIVGFEYDGTEFQIMSVSLQMLGNYAKKVTRTIITATGAYTFTVPAGVTQVKGKGWGAGGGGGFGFSANGGGSGGGGGSYFEWTVAVNPGDSITGSVGAAGANGTSGGSNGQTGGSTSMTYNAVTVTAAGGVGGNGANAGAVGGSVSGGSVTGSPDFARTGQPSFGGTLQGSSPTVAGTGGSCPSGGYGGNAGTGAGNSGAVPGGGGAGSGNSQTAGAGARGEMWFEY